MAFLGTVIYTTRPAGFVPAAFIFNIMKQEYISSCRKFRAVKLDYLPYSGIPCTGLIFDVKRITDNKEVGTISLNTDVKRWRFCASPLVDFYGIDLLDLQCLITEIRQDYNNGSRRQNNT